MTRRAAPPRSALDSNATTPGRDRSTDDAEIDRSSWRRAGRIGRKAPDNVRARDAFDARRPRRDAPALDARFDARARDRGPALGARRPCATRVRVWRRVTAED
eukprot:30917-Pelagococcus_subviridis.AAC.7